MDPLPFPERDLRMLISIGRAGLLIGLGFLGECTTLSRLGGSLGEQAFYGIAAFSLEITGWVAIWRPSEIFLCEGRPILRRRRQYERLAQMPVRILTPEGDAGALP